MRFGLGKPYTTLTIIGRCDRTGLLGVCLTSSPLAVASRCPFIRANVAAVSTQSYSDPGLGPFALELLAMGYSPAAAIEELRRSDPWIEYRQLGVVDRKGKTAVFTGSKNLDWKGHIHNKNFVAMGNNLASGQVVEAMAEAFQGSENEILEERLLRAIEAGRDAGGEKAGHLSAGVIVYGQELYPRTDLRIDKTFSGDPVRDLRDVFNDYRPLIPYYEQRPQNPQMESWRDWLAKRKSS